MLHTISGLQDPGNVSYVIYRIVLQNDKFSMLGFLLLSRTAHRDIFLTCTRSIASLFPSPHVAPKYLAAPPPTSQNGRRLNGPSMQDYPPRTHA